VTVPGGAAAAAAGSPAAVPPPPGSSAASMSIGEVLAHLRAEFPDTTISKLRFLEAEGLVEPRRTPSGYRKYSWHDVARLRYVLTAQRDQYLPLRVIREHLAAMDRGELAPGLASVEPAGPAPPEVRLRRDELLVAAGVGEGQLRSLEEFGLVAAQPGDWYDAEALEIATVAAAFAQYGLEVRHLRAYRAAADREIGLFAQLVSPHARQRSPEARARAAETVRELAALSQRLHAALVRAGLRTTLGR